MLAPNWLESLERRLREPLPGIAAHRRMAPSLAYGRHAGPPAASARPAAVALLLYPDDDGTWGFPLTVRPRHMKDHAGQVCLPGGVMECRESDELCAIREAEEELGIRGDLWRVVGRLTPLYVFGTDFRMQPIVLVGSRKPPWRPNPDEVAQLLEISLDEFASLPPAGRIPMERSGLCFESPAWSWHGFQIWGATAMVLAEWQQILSELHEGPPNVGRSD